LDDPLTQNAILVNYPDMTQINKIEARQLLHPVAKPATIQATGALK